MSAAAPSAYRRHQVCQTCLRASSSFAKKLRLGTDPRDQAFNLEQCLTCSQRARAASQAQLPEESSGDAAQPQLRPRRLFLKDASPLAPASSTAEVAVGSAELDLNSAREGLEGDECPPEIAPSSPAAVHALPVRHPPPSPLPPPSPATPYLPPHLPTTHLPCPLTPHPLVAHACVPPRVLCLHALPALKACECPPRRRTLCPRSPHGARWPRQSRRHQAHQAVAAAASRVTCSGHGLAVVARRRQGRLRARRVWRHMRMTTVRLPPLRRPTLTAGGARLSLAARHPRRRRRRPPMASKPYVEAASRPTPTWPPSPPACAASRSASAHTRNARERSRPVGCRARPIFGEVRGPHSRRRGWYAAPWVRAWSLLISGGWYRRGRGLELQQIAYDYERHLGGAAIKTTRERGSLAYGCIEEPYAFRLSSQYRASYCKGPT